MEIKASNVFKRNYSALQNDGVRFVVNQGGSRSSKTYSLCQMFIIYALQNPNIVISVVRKTFPALKATVLRDFIEVLRSMNLYDVSKHNRTEQIYTFDNGTMLEFFSVDDEQKVRGRKRDICWCNEANELWLDDFTQLNMRTSGKMFFDYNPSDSQSWLYTLPPDETIMIKSTYKDNPFLDVAIKRQIENLKLTDEALYQIYALGERSISKSNIYNTWTKIDQRPERFTDYIYGLDFGYNHPTALIKVWYFENEIYLEEIIYESYLTTTDLIEKMKSVGVDQVNEIMADYSRPEIIREIQNAGYNCLNANKEVKKGIDLVKSKIVTFSGKHIQREYENYKWKKNHDTILDEPVKLFDDAMDAIRYANHHICTNINSNNTYQAF
jgi:phage terminase large subunit